MCESKCFESLSFQNVAQVIGKYRLSLSRNQECSLTGSPFPITRFLIFNACSRENLPLVAWTGDWGVRAKVTGMSTSMLSVSVPVLLRAQMTIGWMTRPLQFALKDIVDEGWATERDGTIRMSFKETQEWQTVGIRE